MAGGDHDDWLRVLGVPLPPPSGTAAGGAHGLPRLDETAYGREMFTVGDYLRQHHLMRSGPNLMLDGNTLSVAEVVDLLVRQLHLTSDREVVTQWVQDEARQAQDFWTLGQGGGATRGAGSRPAPTYQLSYAFIPVTAHVDTRTGATSTDSPQHQASLGATIALHPDGAAGPELSWQLQVAAEGNNFRVTSILQGVQAAWVIPFLDGALQISALVSAATGASRGTPTAGGTVPMVPTSQVGAGGQVTYTIPGTHGTVQIGFQAAASVTAQQGSNPTADFSPQGFIQIQWN